MFSATVYSVSDCIVGSESASQQKRNEKKKKNEVKDERLRIFIFITVIYYLIIHLNKYISKYYYSKNLSFTDYNWFSSVSTRMKVIFYILGVI